mmetsp:Transcript_47373/g.157055  ORF Transcript_47373/g.157055 Transcript_47373/m.157055 type:complete len:339 (+) Transcript_47373:126-1142(+)
MHRGGTRRARVPAQHELRDGRLQRADGLPDRPQRHSARLPAQQAVYRGGLRHELLVPEPAKIHALGRAVDARRATRDRRADRLARLPPKHAGPHGDAAHTEAGHVQPVAAVRQARRRRIPDRHVRRPRVLRLVWRPGRDGRVRPPRPRGTVDDAGRLSDTRPPARALPAIDERAAFARVRLEGRSAGAAPRPGRFRAAALQRKIRLQLLLARVSRGWCCRAVTSAVTGGGGDRAGRLLHREVQRPLLAGRVRAIRVQGRLRNPHSRCSVRRLQGFSICGRPRRAAHVAPQLHARPRCGRRARPAAHGGQAGSEHSRGPPQRVRGGGVGEGAHICAQAG